MTEKKRKYKVTFVKIIREYFNVQVEAINGDCAYDMMIPQEGYIVDKVELVK